MEITPKQLEEMLARLMAEARKPADPTPEELEAQEEKRLAKEAALSARRAQAELVLAQMANKRQTQLSCSHMRRDGSTQGVYVQDGNYIICQACQAIIRPGVCKDPTDSTSIYDTNLFNRLFQLQSPTTF